MFSLLIPLYYQLTQAYKPVTLVVPTPTVIPEISVVPSPSVLGVHVGGEGQVRTIAFFGDSMIQTLKNDILEKSFSKYFPTTKFNILNYGYSSTNLENAINKLTFVTSQNPDIIVIESFAYNNFGNSSEGLEKHSQLLAESVKTIKSKLPKSTIIIASTIAPNSIVFTNGISNLHLSALEKIERTKTIKLYLENAIKFAQKHNLPLTDAYHLSLIDNDGFLPLISTSDHLHPSDFGQEFFGDLVARTLKDSDSL